MTEVATLIAAVAVLVTALTGTLVAWSSHRKIIDNNCHIKEVHSLVNSRMTHVLERVDQLTEALKASGTTVPPDE